MSKQLEQLEQRKRKLEQKIKAARKKERERSKAKENKRLQAMGRYVRDNEELFKRFINEAAPKLPAYLRNLFDAEIKAGGPVKKSATAKSTGKKRGAKKSTMKKAS